VVNNTNVTPCQKCAARLNGGGATELPCWGRRDLITSKDADLFTTSDNQFFTVTLVKQNSNLLERVDEPVRHRAARSVAKSLAPIYDDDIVRVEHLL
jgi:hypothetical protein